MFPPEAPLLLPWTGASLRRSLELQRLSDDFPTPSSAQAPTFCTRSRKAQLAQSLTGSYSQEVWEITLTERGQTQMGRGKTTKCASSSLS